MVTNLQFAGVAAYLLWCLFASLSDRLVPDGHVDESVFDESNKNVPVA